jgi:Tfp pilus assembly protein PilN
MGGAAILVLALSLFNFHRYVRTTSEIHEMEERISHLEKESVRNSPTPRPVSPPSKKETDTMKEQVGFVNRLIATDVFPWGRLLDELESCTPSNILILRFSTTKEKDRLRIEGKAASMSEIAEFLRALDRSSVYRNSALLNVSTPKDAGQAATSNGSAIRFEIEAVAAVEAPFQKQG